MATSYTGLRVQDTYNAIIKIGDNSNLTGTPKLLSDGLGNDSPLYLSGTRLGIGISPAYQFHTSGNAKIGGNLIISGNLTVNGTLTYLNVEDLAVEDPIIKLAKDNTANTLDIGLFGKYVATGTKYKGFFNDASDDKFKLFIGTTVEPTTTVDTSATGYTIGTLVANLEGNVTGGTISGTTGTFSGLLKSDTLELTSGFDHLTITETSGDWTINNAQQNNGITIYDGTGGIDLKYAGTSYLNVDINGVSVANNIDFFVDTDTLYVDSTNENVGINSTGNTDYSLYVNGKIASNNYVIASLGNAGVALTHNDGYGNANVTFNHVSGTPEQNGNSFRIECNTDSIGNPAMIFELAANVTSGVAVSTTEKMRLDETGVKVRDTAGGIIHLERDDSSIVNGNPLGRLRFTGDDPVSGTFNIGAEIRGEAAGTWSTDNYPSELQFYTTATNSYLLALTLDSSQNATFGGDVDVNSFVEIGEDGTYPTSYGAVGFGGRTNGYARIFGGLTNKHIYITSGTSGDIKLRVNGNSANVWTIDTSGHLIPDTDIDIGDSSNRVREIYTTNIDISGTLKDSDGDAGTSGQILSSTGTGTDWIDFNADSAKALEIDVKNVHGSTLAKGTVVHAEPTGTLSGNVIEVVAADANTKMPAIGILNEALVDDGEGKAVMFGTVQGIDTSGFSVGDELYVSATAGAFTSTKPTATTDEVQKIAIVVKSHASNGLIKVFGAGRANDVPNLLTRDITIDGADFYFGNADQIRMGDSLGLRIQHTGSHSYIDTEIGNMYFRAEANNSEMVFQADDGNGGNANYFYLDGSLATHDGTNTTQTVTVFPDNSKIQLGDDASGDFRLFHNGTNSFIENNTGNIEIINYSDDKDIIFKSDNGSGDVIEYFRVDGSEQRVVYGRSAQMADNVTLFFGNSDNSLIRYDSTAQKTLFVGDTDFTGLFTMKKTSTAALQTILKIENTGDNGSQEDLILSNTFDRDVGIKFETLGGYHHLWQDSAGDDSLIISAAGIASTDITMEFYQNHNVEIPNGNLTMSGGDLILDDGTTESPHIILKDDDDVEFRIYNADSNTFYITRSNNSGADFIINANATDYTQSTFSFAGATLSAATIGNWNTAYNDHITGVSFSTSTGVLTLTQQDAGTLTQDLDGRYAVFRGDVLFLENGEITDFTAAYQMVFDANDADTDVTTLGDFAGGYPAGVYFLGDGGLTGTTLGTGLVKVWNTGHFAKQNILDWETAYDDKINSASFDTSDGVLTLTRQDAGTVTVDLDGRYLELSGGTLTGDLEIQNSGRPTLTLDDNGNAGGGGAEGVILFKNNDGNAIGLGYTDDITSTSDFIISTDASSTYGGYLGLDALAIDDSSDIILDPKTELLVTKNATFDGSIKLEGPDGGLVLRNWTANSGYASIATNSMTGSEYVLLTDGTNTFLSGGGTGYVRICGGTNATAHSLEISTSSAKFNGTVIPNNNATQNFGSSSNKWNIGYFSSLRITNVVTNKILKFDGTDIDDSIMTDDGSTVTVSGEVKANRFILASTGTTTPVNRYLFTDNTNTGTGRLIIQSGGGSSAYGGAINLFSHSHASKAGWVTAGISSGSGGKFTVNTEGLAGGTDVFTVDTSGAATFAGDVTFNSNIILNGASNEIIKSNGSIRLNIDSDNNQTDRVFIVSTGNNSELFRVNESGDGTFQGDVTVNGFFTSQGIDDNANAKAITINGNEEVGIGTITPFYKLDVNGTFRASGNATFAGDVTASSGTGHFSIVNSSAYQLNGTYVMDSSRNLVNIGGIRYQGNIQYENDNFENTIVGGSEAPYVYQDMREYMQEKGHYADSAWIIKPNQDVFNHEVVAYQNNTNVYVDDRWIATIDRMERYQIAASLLSDFSKVTADKPIVCHKDDPDTVSMNTAFSGTILGGFATRYYPVNFAIYSPFGKTDIAIYRSTVQTGVDISGTPILTATLGAEQGTTLTESPTPTTDTYYYVLVSDLPVTAAFTPSGGDNTLMAPIGMEVLGNDECSNSFGIDDGTLTSSITNKTNSEARLARDTTGKLGCFMYGTADGAGGDAEYGVPIERLSDNYIYCHEDISNFRLVSYKANKIQVLDKDDNVLYSIDHSAATKNVPLSHQEGTSAGSGTTLSSNGPFNFVGSAPFHLVCQNNASDDECVMLGAMNNKITNNKSFNGGQITNGLHLLPFGGNQLTELTLQGSSNQIEFIDNDVSSHRAKISSELGNLLFEVDLQQASASTAIEFKMDGGTALSFDANKDATFEGDVTFNGSVSYSSIGTTAGYTVSNTNLDSSSNPEGSGAEAIRLEHPNYTSGTYVHEFAKIQRVSGVPLYLRQTFGSTTFSNIIRFGSHSLSAYEFEVFGEGKMNRLALGSDNTALNASGVPEYPLYIVENTAGAAWIADQDSATDPATNAPTLTLQNLDNTNNNSTGINFVDAGGDVAVGTYSQITNQANHYGKYKIYTRGADGYNERISIDSGSVNIGSGMPQHKLEVYTNGTKFAGSFDYSGTSGTVGVMKFRLGGGSTSPSYVDFIYGSTQTGAITTNGTSTIYLTSSDYRLKENLVELNGALDRLDNLQPKRFNFISDSETTVDGFIAHEVADVVPEAVRGEKDAVNEDGDIIPQGIDQSKLVPLLVAALKELRAEVKLLKSQINS